MKTIKLLLTIAVLLLHPALSFAEGNGHNSNSGANHHNNTGGNATAIALQGQNQSSYNSNTNTVEGTVNSDIDFNVDINPAIYIGGSELISNTPVTVHDGNNTNTNTATINTGAIQVDGSNSSSTSNAVIEDGAISVTSGDSNAVIEAGAVENTNTLVGGDTISIIDVDTSDTVGDVTSDSTSESSSDNSMDGSGNSNVTINTPRQIPAFVPQPANLSYIGTGEQVRLPETAGWEIFEILQSASRHLWDVEYHAGTFQKIVIGDDDGGFKLVFIPFKQDILDYQSTSNNHEQICSGGGKRTVCKSVQSTSERVSIQRIKPVMKGRQNYEPLGMIIAICDSECSMPGEIRIRADAGVHSVLPPHYKDVRFLYLPSTRVSVTGQSGDSYNVGGSGSRSLLGDLTLSALGLNGGFGESNSMAVMGIQGFQGFVFEKTETGRMDVDLQTLFQPLAKKVVEEKVAVMEPQQPVNVTVNIQHPEVAQKELENPVAEVKPRKKFVPEREIVEVKINNDKCNCQ